MDNLELTLFLSALGCYLVASLLYVYFLSTRSKTVGKVATAVTSLGVIAHTVSFGLRWSLAGHLPLVSWYEYLSAFTLALAAIYLIVERISSMKTIGAFTMPISWLLMGIALTKRVDPQPLPPALRSFWFYLHTTGGAIAYGAFAVAFGIAVIYLLQERNMKRKVNTYLFKRLPPLEVLDHLSYRSIVFAFPLLTVVIVSGAIWADQAWGRYWGWDPKETSSLVTWLLFAAYMHARITAGWRGKKAAWLAIAGFAAVLLTFFGFNYISGLHGYAL